MYDSLSNEQTVLIELMYKAVSETAFVMVGIFSEHSVSRDPNSGRNAVITPTLRGGDVWDIAS